MTPTNELRFVRRMDRLILQQKWTNRSGFKQEWRDVPVAEE